MNRKTWMFLGLILLLAPSAFAKDKDTDKTLPPNCTDGQVAKREEGTQTWVCATQLNPLQVALLRWYEANEAGNDFAVGNFPRGVAFDGANIWLANTFDATVSKLRASDGTDLGTFAVGPFPTGVAFDGANIWVTNTFDATVSKR